MQTKIDLEMMAEVFKLLGNKTRLMIITILYQEECCVCELVETFDMTQPAISQHLRKLRDVKIVNEERQGQWIYYSINKKSPIFPLLESLEEFIPEQKGLINKIKRLEINC